MREEDQRLSNVCAVRSRRHGESVLSVVRQLTESQESNVFQDYQRALAEVERRGVPAEVMKRLPLLPSGSFVVTLPGLRALRNHAKETPDDKSKGPGLS